MAKLDLKAFQFWFYPCGDQQRERLFPPPVRWASVGAQSQCE